MVKKLALLVFALALVAAILYGFLPGPVKVETAPVGRGHLAITVDEEGRTRVRERYTVSAPVAGHVRRIALKTGDTITAGAVVALIEPARSASLDPRSRAQAEAQADAARASVKAAMAAVASAQAEAQLAQQELTRADALFRDRFVSQAAVDQARTRQSAATASQRAAEQNAQVAEYQLIAARAALSDAGKPAQGGVVAVTAPVAGRVLGVPHESEGTVAAGQALIEIGNPDSLEIVVEVLSTAAVRLAPGTPVRLDRWGGDTVLEGRVRVIEPAGFTKVSALGVEEQRVRVIADLASPPEQWQKLGDGYRVEASFVVWENKDVLLVPTSALFRVGDSWAVFTVEAGRAKQRPVRIGQRSGLAAQVLEGLKEGEPVIARPDDRVGDGVKVRASPS